jgi:hypothetical protein
MKLHWRAAPGNMSGVLRQLSRPLADLDFYLAGGTALALIEGHRVSVDLDLFSGGFEDPEALLPVIESTFPEAVTTLVGPRTLYLDISGTSVSLMGYTYPLIAPLLEPEPGLVPLASREDIAAMKLAAIASRGSRKDFVDLWWLVSRRWSLEQCLELFERKFESRDIGHVIRALTYFDDAELEPPLRYLVEIDWETVKRDLTKRVVDLMTSD